MKKLLIALVLICNTCVYADSWLPTALPIPPGSSTGVWANVNMAYNEANQTIVGAWGELFTDIPYYAVYDGTAWTTAGTPIPLGASAGVNTDINLTYDAATQTVIAAWADSSSFLPYYAVFDGTSWITAGTPIPLGTSTGVNTTISNVNLTYNAANQTVVAAWTDRINSIPYYAVFDGTTWITPGTPIPLGASGSAKFEVALTYNAANQTVVAAWDDNYIHLPYYAVFDGTNWITSGTLIPLGSSFGLSDYGSIKLTYDAAHQTVIAAWPNKLSPNVPFYSVFNGTSWIITERIPVGTSSGVYQDVTLAFNSVSNTVFAAWTDNANVTSDDPFFSIFNGLTWTPGAIIPFAPTLGAHVNVTLAFHTAARQMVAAWRQGSEFPLAYPFYNIYLTSDPVPPPPAPPASLSESGCCLNFASQRLRVDHITWTASPSLGVVAYQIYKNEKIIGVVDANTLEFNIPANCTGVNDVYSVTALSIFGFESLPITVTISGQRSCRGSNFPILR